MKKFAQILGFLLSLMLYSCLVDQELEIPTSQTMPPMIAASQILDIETLYSIWFQNTNGEEVLELDASYADKYLEGYVISNDEKGNFFEELYLQDRSENPQKGIKVLIDSSPLFSRYNFGRRVYIQLKGVSLGVTNGVFTLGMAANNTVAPISEVLANQLLVRDTLTAQIIPRPVTIGTITPDVMNMYLRLEEVQFHRSQIREGAVLTYAGEPEDLYDGERLMESCTDGSKILFSTSSFADFKGMELEQGSGFVDGIALFDYYGERMVFTVNDVEDIALVNELRCDPEVLSCDTIMEEMDTIWTANFENISGMNDLLQQGWMVYSPLENNTSWELDAFGGNSYVRISGYSSDESAIESWLISPILEIGAFQEKSLSFEVQASYDNGARLNVFIATNFDGSPENATWQALDLVVSPGPYEGFGDIQAIGPIALSCIEGPFVLAWVYEGSDPYQTTRFHIDNIKLKGS